MAGDTLVVPALLDSGADCTLVPEAVARALRLPAVDEITITGVAGGERRVSVHAARLGFAGGSVLARVAALGKEAILGRDLLNQVLLRLDGPRLTLDLRGYRGRVRAGVQRSR